MNTKEKTIKHIKGEGDLNETINNFPGISLLDFYADRCGPCKMLSPIMEELLIDNNDIAFQVLKINIDENGSLAEKYWIMSIPQVFFIKNGKVVEQFNGVFPKEKYQEKINEIKA